MSLQFLRFVCKKVLPLIRLFFGTTNVHIVLIKNQVFLFDSLDVVEDLIHPYWKQFDIENTIPDSWHYGVAVWITLFGIFGVLGNLLVITTFMRFA